MLGVPHHDQLDAAIYGYHQLLLWTKGQRFALHSFSSFEFGNVTHFIVYSLRFHCFLTFQMNFRSHTDCDLGPLEELDNWKKRLA